MLGGVSAALVLAGVLSPLGLPVIDTANFFGYVLWSVWLIALAVVILVHERRRRLVARPEPGRGDVVTRAGAGSRWACCALSLLAIVIDNTIVNVALPTLVRDLDANVSELQWVVDAYTLVFAGLLLLAGALGDRFGRRRTLLVGLAVFGVASAAAAYASGVDGLIAARAVMGAGAAFIMPATLSLLISVFTDTRERAMAIGIWAATAGLGVALGPVVGGFLLDHFWWGSIFIVNVPLTAIAIVAGRGLIPESRDPVARRIDWTGAALSAAGLVALVWAIIEAPSKGWTSAPVVGAAAFAAAALVAFVVQQRRAAEPLLDVRLFRDPRFTAATSTITVLFFALFGFLFLSTQYLQFVLGYSPSEAGLRVLPYAGAMIVFAPLSSRLVVRFGTKRVATAGMVLFSAGLAIAATITTSGGYGRLAAALLLMGAGMGLAGAPATESIMGSLPPERANIGAAVNDTTRELGGALGVAVVGSIMSSLYATRAPRRRSRSRPRVPRSRRQPRRHHRRRGIRGVRARDVTRVDRRRARCGARRRDRMALSAGRQRRGERGQHVRRRAADGGLAAPQGRLESLLAVAGVGGVEVDAGLDDLVDAVEDGGVERDVGGGQLAVELLHRPRADDRRGHRRVVDDEARWPARSATRPRRRRPARAARPLRACAGSPAATCRSAPPAAAARARSASCRRSSCPTASRRPAGCR